MLSRDVYEIIHVIGIALVTLYSPEGWIGRYLEAVGIQAVYTPFGIVLALNVGRAEGIKIGMAAVPVPAVADVEKQCVAWFFNADLKAAKKHMCGGKHGR